MIGFAAKQLTAAAVVIVSVISSVGVGRSQDLVLRVGYLRTPEPLNLSRIQGFLEKAVAPLLVKVDWKGPFGALAPAAEALNANAIDVSMGSSTAALTAISGDAPISLFAYAWDNGDDTGIVVRNGSPIKSVHDLVGKTVAVNRGGTGDYMLARALEKAGIPADQVKKAYLAPPDSASALSQNKVDAWAAWGTFYPVALADLDARVIARGQDFDAENATIYAIRTDYAAKNPKVVGELLVALRQANAWMTHNPAENADIWSRELKISPQAAHLITTFRNNRPGPIGDKEMAALNRQNAWMVEQKIMRQQADLPSHVVTNFGGVPIE